MSPSYEENVYDCDDIGPFRRSQRFGSPGGGGARSAPRGCRGRCSAPPRSRLWGCRGRGGTPRLALGRSRLRSRIPVLLHVLGVARRVTARGPSRLFTAPVVLIVRLARPVPQTPAEPPRRAGSPPVLLDAPPPRTGRCARPPPRLPALGLPVRGLLPPRAAGLRQRPAPVRPGSAPVLAPGAASLHLPDTRQPVSSPQSGPAPLLRRLRRLRPRGLQDPTCPPQRRSSVLCFSAEPRPVVRRSRSPRRGLRRPPPLPHRLPQLLGVPRPRMPVRRIVPGLCLLPLSPAAPRLLGVPRLRRPRPLLVGGRGPPRPRCGRRPLPRLVGTRLPLPRQPPALRVVVPCSRRVPRRRRPPAPVLSAFSPHQPGRTPRGWRRTEWSSPTSRSP